MHSNTAGKAENWPARREERDRGRGRGAERLKGLQELEAVEHI